MKQWDIAFGELSSESIQKLYSDRQQFRVSHKSLRPGETFGGTAKAGTIYMVEGQCQFWFEKHGGIDLKKGDIFSFPLGEYSALAEPECGCNYTMVWNIGDLVHGHNHV